MALRPDEVIFVDDSDKNITGANALGIRGILFKENSATLREIERLAG